MDNYNYANFYVSHEDIIHGSKKLVIYYVRPEYTEGYLGFALRETGQAFINNDLPPRQRNYVKFHELYHLIDEYTWGGIFGKEIRAEFYAMCREPIGGLYLLADLLTNRERLTRYLKHLTSHKSTL